ncbi:MFS transporter [Lacticaseibacillus sp. GG6-2]
MVLDESVSLRQKLAIVSCGLLSFTGILVETSMNVTFPTLIQEMHVTLDTVQWLATAYLLLVTIVMSTTAYVLKRFAPKRVFLFAISVCMIGGLMCLLAPNFWVLLAGRLLQAVATGISTPLMYQLIFATVPAHKLGIYTGFASVIVSLAPALGPTYGGVLTSLWSWRAIFLGILPLIVVVALLGAWVIQGQPQGVGQRHFDYIGVLLLAAVFTSLLFTFNAAGRHGWLTLSFGLWLLVTLLVAGLLVAYAKHSMRQIFDYHILADTVLRLRLVNYFSLQFINIGLSFVLPLFAQTVLGASASVAGLMLLPGALIGAAIAPIAGGVYDRRGPTRVLTFSAVMVCLSMAVFWLSGRALSVGLIAVLFVCLRLGFNSGFGTVISDASTQVQGHQKADQNALFSMMQQYAGSVGTAIMSAVIASRELTQTAKTATMAGTRFDFLLLFGLGLVIMFTVYRVWQLQRK